MSLLNLYLIAQFFWMSCIHWNIYPTVPRNSAPVHWNIVSRFPWHCWFGTVLPRVPKIHF